MISQNQIRQALLTKRRTLTERDSQIEDALRQPLDRDWEERATEIEASDTLPALEDATHAELAAINDALARLDAGTYGICVSCGAPISEARLQAMPTAKRCITCAR